MVDSRNSTENSKRKLMQLKVYLDNVIYSGIVRWDLSEPENAAVRQLIEAPFRNMITIWTSRESWQEQDRAKDDDVRRKLRENRENIPVVPYDRGLLGACLTPDLRGSFIINPAQTEIIDQRLLDDLMDVGLKIADARHLMYATCNGCDRFLTTDHHFLDRISALETRCATIRILKPSDMVTELEQQLTAA